MSNVYLAGPMTGKKDFNFSAFCQAALKWRAAGFSVYNPAENFDGRTDLPRIAYLRVDLWAILNFRNEGCQIIAVLPGWENSEGATLEVAVGRAIGCTIVDAVTGQVIDGNDYLL